MAPERRKSDREHKAPKRFDELEDDEAVQEKQQSTTTTPEKRAELIEDSALLEDEVDIVAATPLFYVRLPKRGEIKYASRQALFDNGPSGDARCQWMQNWVGRERRSNYLSDLDNTLVNWAGMIKRMPPAFADKQLFFLKGDEAHSILCITPSQRPNDGRWYAVEGEEKLTSGKCCKSLWARNCTIKYMMTQEVVKKAFWLMEHHENAEIYENMQKAKKDACAEYSLVENYGFMKISTEDEVHNFVRDTLVRYGRMNGGMPAFSGITDRKAYKVGESPGFTPLEKSARAQLKISSEWVRERLPKTWEYIIRVTGARKLYCALLYSEGVNWLRYHRSVTKLKKKIPFPMTVDWLKENVPREAEALCASLRQTAHKDIVDGALTDFGGELPKQLVMALTEQVKLHMWVDEHGKGCLKPQTTSQWREEVKSGRIRRKEKVLKPGEGVLSMLYKRMLEMVNSPIFVYSSVR